MKLSQDAAFVGLMAGAVLPVVMAQSPADAPSHIDDPGKWGKVARVLPPEYPPGALAGGVTGSVDVEGVVTGWGTLQDVEYRPRSDPAAVFVEPLKSVMRHWRFHPTLGNDCMPRNVRVTTRVIFEIEEGKPKISVERVRGNAAGGVPQYPGPAFRPHPTYPAVMLRAEVEARTYNLQIVNPAGDVVGVESKVFPLHGDRAVTAEDPQYREIVSHFEQANYRALTRRRYEAQPEGNLKPRRICGQVDYKLRD
jgi:TonB family protein